MSAYADQRGTVRLLVRGAVFRDRITHAYVLGQAAKSYRDGEMFTGVIKAAAPLPFPVAVGLGAIRQRWKTVSSLSRADGPYAGHWMPVTAGRVGAAGT
ncbi:hypothetical protein ACH4MM_28220 [Streptomyces pratensis]|uniref:hypothetical protein n=1 Tax=Streptomyces pratensis TaxID=1169025 RepID=UPI0037A26B3F